MRQLAAGCGIMGSFEGERIAATAPGLGRSVDGDPSRSPPPELAGYGPGRPPWSAPNGRDLLAGISILFVLAAVLVVLDRHGPEPARRRPGAPEPLRAARAANVEDPAAEWAEVPLATSVVELGPGLAQPVADGLAEARARIARCVAVERRRDPAAAALAPDSRPAELVLRLTPRSGAVHVVGVEPVESGAPAVLEDCARRQLDGDAFPASAAVPGRRYRLLVGVR